MHMYLGGAGVQPTFNPVIYSTCAGCNQYNKLLGYFIQKASITEHFLLVFQHQIL